MRFVTSPRRFMKPRQRVTRLRLESANPQLPPQWLFDTTDEGQTWKPSSASVAQPGVIRGGGAYTSRVSQYGNLCRHGQLASERGADRTALSAPAPACAGLGKKLLQRFLAVHRAGHCGAALLAEHTKRRFWDAQVLPGKQGRGETLKHEWRRKARHVPLRVGYSQWTLSSHRQERPTDHRQARATGRARDRDGVLPSDSKKASPRRG